MTTCRRRACCTLFPPRAAGGASASCPSLPVDCSGHDFFCRSCGWPARPPPPRRRHATWSRQSSATWACPDALVRPRHALHRRLPNGPASGTRRIARPRLAAPSQKPPARSSASMAPSPMPSAPPLASPSTIGRPSRRWSSSRNDSASHLRPCSRRRLGGGVRCAARRARGPPLPARCLTNCEAVIAAFEQAADRFPAPPRRRRPGRGAGGPGSAPPVA